MLNYLQVLEVSHEEEIWVWPDSIPLEDPTLKSASRCTVNAFDFICIPAVELLSNLMNM